MLPFALSIFTGAFLLFQVQPLIGKYILPWFGGTPGVWNTCLLFFQLVLLGGYAYAHWSTSRLTPRNQAKLHLALLVVSLALLPIIPSDSWKDHVSGDPTWRVLLLLAATIGLPYLVLSATGPLLQQWFSQVRPGVSPYRLYALSNVGSLLALLTFPVYFEVEFTRRQLALMWSGGLVLFALVCGACAWMIWRRSGPAGEGTAPAGAPAAPVSAMPEPDLSPTRGDKALWLTLPAIATALLLATTNKLCMEVAVLPFLWIAPLALYLLSFIICFDHSRWYERTPYIAMLVIAAGVVVHLIEVRSGAPFSLQILGYSGAFFIACMVCHGELYRMRPPVRLLTSYYLHISAGGAIGGLFVAVVAPNIFDDFRELQLSWWAVMFMLAILAFRYRSLDITAGTAMGVMAVTLVVPALLAGEGSSLGFWSGLGENAGSFAWWREMVSGFAGDFWTELDKFYRAYGWWIGSALALFFACTIDLRERGFIREWRPRVSLYVVILGAAFGAILLGGMRDRFSAGIIHQSRNFYGTLKIYDYYPDEPDSHYRLLVHGATTHGLQFVKPALAKRATSYYSEGSGVGLSISEHPRQQDRKFGVVGLGTGTMAVYGRAGDTVRFYDINTAVETLARDTFTHLKDSEAKIEVVIGDARLSLERELRDGQRQQFDVLALDAFSSDAIPVHLLTREAFATYIEHMRPDGVIAVHISNRYLDLQPVVETLADEFGYQAVTVSEDDTKMDWWVYRSTWVLVTKNQAVLTSPKVLALADTPHDGGPVLWTDDYASLFRILR